MNASLNTVQHSRRRSRSHSKRFFGMCLTDQSNKMPTSMCAVNGNKVKEGLWCTGSFAIQLQIYSKSHREIPLWRLFLNGLFMILHIQMQWSDIKSMSVWSISINKNVKRETFNERNYLHSLNAPINWILVWNWQIWFNLFSVDNIDSSTLQWPVESLALYVLRMTTVKVFLVSIYE